ncbi:MAG: hypothetical protein RIQ53_2252 [Pseudomonadota bacterium]
MPPSPRLDPEAGVNPFAWIIHAAKHHRAARSEALEDHRKARASERRAEGAAVSEK